MITSENGFFGEFGGRFVDEKLEKKLIELEEAFKFYIKDKDFLNELEELRSDFLGRPTPLMYAKNISESIGGAKIYVKLEGFAHTGAHKINNSIGQALLAKRMGKKKIIAETGAGQHGIATAAACAKLGLECSIYMGEIDVRRQQPNVASMELYGANVVSVKRGSRGLKDAVDAALEEWIKDLDDTHYLLGSAVGPSPYPDIVRTFQSIIGRELEKQIAEKNLKVKSMFACVGGGSNAIGFFEPFIEKTDIELVAIEAGGIGSNIGENAVRMNNQYAKDHVAQGYKSKFILKENGEISDTMSISAGLDYPGIGPQLAYLGDIGRIKFLSATDMEAINAVKEFAKHEGVIFALESAHAGAKAIEYAKKCSKDDVIIVNMSGRGDKDIFITSPIFRAKRWKEFLQDELNRLENNIDIHNFK